MVSGILHLKGVGSIIALYIIIGIILAVYIILRLSVTVSYRANSETDEIKLSAKWLWFTIYPRPDKPPKTIKIKNGKSKKSKKPKKSKQTLKEDISEIEEEFVEMSEDELDDKIKALEKELERQEQNVKQASEIPKTEKKPSLEETDNKSKKKQKDNRIKKFQDNKPKEGGFKAKFNNIRRRWGRYKDYVPMTWKSFRKLLKQIRFYDTEIEITAGKDDAYDAAMQYGRLNAVLFHGLGVVGTVFSLYKPKRAEVKCVFDKKVFEYKLSGKIKIRPSTVLAIVIVFGVKFLYLFLKKRHKAKRQYKLKRKLMLNSKELLANE